MSDDIRDQRPVSAVIVLLLIIAGLITWDLALDYGEGADWRHVAIEFTVLLAATAGVVLLWGRLARTRSDLAAARDQAEAWRRQNRELVRGLGVAIENQFAEWGLTRAESEVGLLLLKGLSHKEIAAVRATSERTIREQARAVYRKSGLSGRSALSAFFLEDLLLPDETRG